MTKTRQAGDLRLIRGAMLLFLLLTCLRVWAPSLSVESPAQAQIPDSGLQRKQILEEVKESNRLLAEIRLLLEKGTLNVRVKGADN